MVLADEAVLPRHVKAHGEGAARVDATGIEAAVEGGNGVPVRAPVDEPERRPRLHGDVRRIEAVIEQHDLDLGPGRFRRLRRIGRFPTFRGTRCLGLGYGGGFTMHVATTGRRQPANGVEERAYGTGGD